VLRHAAAALAAAILLGTGGFAASAALKDAPPGATAQCRDGTYSFSQSRSGTCSHHGGVATWLTPAAPTAQVGQTVLLMARLKTSGCAVGPSPDRACSPGAIYAGLTRAVLCSAGFHTSSIRNVPASERSAVEREYGLAARAYGSALEIDHIVSLELGGSNDIANLFPERAAPAPGFHAKDRLENRLHAMVCAGQITLRDAQTGIASNWQRLYRTAFGVSP
jgi:hypothetical protein